MNSFMAASISTECYSGMFATVRLTYNSLKEILKLLSEQLELVAEMLSYCVSVRQTGHFFCPVLVAIERDEPN